MHIRINSGRGVDFRRTNHGYKYLSEMDFAEVCEMRNCQKPVRYTSNYGEYCSKNHAALCGADALGTNLQYVHSDFQQGKEIDFRLRRQQQLGQAAEAMQARPIK